MHETETETPRGGNTSSRPANDERNYEYSLDLQPISSPIRSIYEYELLPLIPSLLVVAVRIPCLIAAIVIVITMR
ncbi:hypothetical protein ESCO_006692 [Escovopsis weberi]|uniref:Uncharacterized protein n=1 Tax=Escovopsis weberi TaxID=150374 RepID=A0A0M8N512_ESCWE|nr:hypothetical protein ESCO_006692 [Escovopsis weberi]